jgi:hypothetical protein
MKLEAARQWNRNIHRGGGWVPFPLALIAIPVRWIETMIPFWKKVNNSAARASANHLTPRPAFPNQKRHFRKSRPCPPERRPTQTCERRSSVSCCPHSSRQQSLQPTTKQMEPEDSREPVLAAEVFLEGPRHYSFTSFVLVACVRWGPSPLISCSDSLLPLGMLMGAKNLTGGKLVGFRVRAGTVFDCGWK